MNQILAKEQGDRSPRGSGSSPSSGSASEGAQPIFLIPGAVTILALLLLVIHAAFEFALDPDGQFMLAVWFGYLPIRLVEANVPGGFWPVLWTPFSHALMHGSWSHVFLNVAWLVIFGTPVARRYGASAFYITFFVGAFCGALAFTLAQWGDLHVLIGASGGVAGLTGLAMRFMFQPPRLARNSETGEVRVLGRKLLPLSGFLTNPRVRTFTLFWVGLNLAIPVYALFSGVEGSQIAWQAHLGGFAGGLLLADLFERSKR